MKKKLLTFTTSMLLAFSLLISFVPLTYANGATCVFVDSNGNEIKYYMDEDGLPYNMKNGEKIYLALPLEQFKITDPELIAELDATINEETTLTSRALPTDIYNLTLKSDPLLSSNAYTHYCSFLNTDRFETPSFKMSSKHSVIRLQTDDIEKPFLGSSKVNFVYRFWYVSTGEWSAITYKDVKCTSSLGFPIQYLSETSYSKYFLILPSDVTAYTAVIWTTVE